MKKFGVILSLCLMAFVGNIKAQDATLAETLEFLTKKIYSNYWTTDDEYSSFKEKHLYYNKFKNRIYIYHQVMIAGKDKDRTNNNYLFLDLNKDITIMQEKNTVVFTYGIYLYREIQLSDYTLKDYTEAKDNFDLKFNDEDAPRVFKAFKHLFKLLNKEITIKESVENKF